MIDMNIILIDINCWYRSKIYIATPNGKYHDFILGSSIAQFVSKFFTDISSYETVSKDGELYVKFSNTWLRDDLSQVGCFLGTNFPNDPSVKLYLTCAATPYPTNIQDKLQYAMGPGCSQNSDCTKSGNTLCDISIGMCYPSSRCVDLAAECNLFEPSCNDVEQDFNKNHLCRKTCGVCSDPTTPTPTPTPPPTPSSQCSQGNGITTMNDGNRAYILGRFNSYRSQVALGKYTMQNGQKTPSTSNMLKLSYSCLLENLVQSLAVNCVSNGIVANAQVVLHHEYVPTISNCHYHFFNLI